MHFHALYDAAGALGTRFADTQCETFRGTNHRDGNHLRAVAIFLLFLFLGGWLANYFYLAMLLWSAYLLYRLCQRRRAGDAFRYAIPVAVVIWSLAEVGAFFGIYTEFWQAPVENPVSMLVMLGLFSAGLVLLLRSEPARG